MIRKFSTAVLFFVLLGSWGYAQNKTLTGYSNTGNVIIWGQKDTVPPEITINRPKNLSRPQPKTFTLKGQVMDSQSAISIVLINNRRVTIDAQGRFEQEITLNGPRTQLTIEAIDIKQNSGKAQHTVLRKNRDPRYYKDYALLFAAEDYKNQTELENPIEEAKTLKTVLEKQYGFHVRLVKNPKRQTIKDVLKDYKEKFADETFDPNGQLLVFFSGHGGKFSKKSGYFVPIGGKEDDPYATCYMYSMFRPTFEKINVAHKLAIVDACHSAYLDPDYRSSSGFNISRPHELSGMDKILAKHKRYKSSFYITSDSKGDKTPDNSELMHWFLNGLKKQRNDYIDLGLLNEMYLDNIEPKPKTGRFKKNDEGNFLFIRNEQE